MSVVYAFDCIIYCLTMSNHNENHFESILLLLLFSKESDSFLHSFQCD